MSTRKLLPNEKAGVKTSMFGIIVIHQEAVMLQTEQITIHVEPGLGPVVSKCAGRRAQKLDRLAELALTGRYQPAAFVAPS